MIYNNVLEAIGHTPMIRLNRLPQADRRLDSYGAALDQYRSWLLKRLEWLDGNIDVLRSYSHESVNKKYNH